MSTPPESFTADNVQPEPVEWLWRDRIPVGMIVLIAGRPGEGKSILAAQVAADVTNMGKNVIISNREDPWAQVIRPRLEAAGAQLRRVHAWNSYKRLPEGIEDLARLIRKTKAKLCVLDPIAAHLGASIYNDQEVRTVLSPLAQIGHDTECSFVFVHHLVKNASPHAHPLRAIGGSGGGLPGAARAVFIFAVDPDDKDDRILAPAKFNLGEEPKSVKFTMDSHEFVIGEGEEATMLSAGKLLMLSDTDTTTARRLLASEAAKATGPKQSKVAKAAEWLTFYLQLGDRPAVEILEDAAHNAIAPKTLRRAADEVGVEKIRVGGSKGQWRWKLPDDHPLAPKGKP